MRRLTSLLPAALLACSSPQPAPEQPLAVLTVGPTVQVTLAQVGLEAAALDKTADPCVDFYQYACGGWIAKTEIPADEPAWYRSFDVIQKRNEETLREILDKAAAQPNAPEFQQLGAYYAACMDEAAVEAAGTQPIEPLLQKIRDLKDARQLGALLGELHRHAIYPLFVLSAEQDFKDATQVIATLDQGGLGLPDRDDYFRQDERSQKVREAYAKHVEAMIGLAGLPRGEIAKAAEEILAIEKQLAEASKTRVERRDPKGLYNPTDRAGLTELAAGFDWEAYFTAVGRPDAAKLSVTSRPFFQRVGQLAKATPVAAWKRYLTWHVVRSTARHLPKRFFDESFRLEQTLVGTAEPMPRWRRCVQSVDAALGEVLGQTFVKQRFSGDSKPAAEAMVKAIGAAFAEAVQKLDWMDDKTRARALEKRRAMEFLIGHPDKWRVYDFTVDKSKHLQNVLASRAFEVRRNLAKIGRPVDRSEWQMSPPTVNAYYDPQKNHMVFPAGILQPPFFSAKHGVAVNLGGIGMVIGHELTHGFDDEGSQFDAVGNLASWWEPDTAKRFSERTQCVAEQYSAYEVQPGLKVNGQLTLGENIADLGGLKLAFAAYKALRKDGWERLEAEGFSEDQQFFLAHAQVWCGKMRPEYERLMVQTNPHSPPRFRVNGPLADLPAFGEAFQCKVGTPLHPRKLCTVW